MCRGGRVSSGGRSGLRGFAALSEGEGQDCSVVEDQMTQIHIDGDFENGDEIEV